MADDIRGMFDLVDVVPSPEFVSSLRARLLDVTTDSVTAIAVALPEEADIMTITEDRHDAGTSHKAPRRAVRWIAAAAVAAGLIITGVLVATRSDDNGAPADQFPPPTELRAGADPTVDRRISRLVVDGENMWAAADGSTYLVRLDPTTGAIEQSVNMPSSSRTPLMDNFDGNILVPTRDGVVIVNASTGDVSGPFAGGDGEVLTVSQNDQGAWLLREMQGAAVLEKWNADFSAMVLSVDLPFEVGGMQAVGDGVYVGTGTEGVLHFGADGSQVGAIDVGYAINLTLGPDGTLWIPDYDSGTVWAVDSSNDEIVGSVQVAPDRTIDVVATAGAVFAVSFMELKLYAIDPTTFEVTATADVVSNPYSVAVVGRTIWVAGPPYVQSFVAA